MFCFFLILFTITFVYEFFFKLFKFFSSFLSKKGEVNQIERNIWPCLLLMLLRIKFIIYFLELFGPI